MPSIKSTYKPAVLSDPAAPPLEIHPTDRPVCAKYMRTKLFTTAVFVFFLKKMNNQESSG